MQPTIGGLNIDGLVIVALSALAGLYCWLNARRHMRQELRDHYQRRNKEHRDRWTR
jgi:hypothetical protein